MCDVFDFVVSHVCVRYQTPVPAFQQIPCMIPVPGHGIVEQYDMVLFLCTTNQYPHEGIRMCLPSWFMVALDPSLICMDHLAFLQHGFMEKIHQGLQPFLTDPVCPICHVFACDDKPKVAPHIFLAF